MACLPDHREVHGDKQKGQGAEAGLTGGRRPVLASRPSLSAPRIPIGAKLESKGTWAVKARVFSLRRISEQRPHAAVSSQQLESSASP